MISKKTSQNRGPLPNDVIGGQRINSIDVDFHPEVPMSDDPFQFISLAEIQALGCPIIHFFDAEYVQEFAELNCGGRLTDDELERLRYAFWETWDCEYLDDAISKIRPWLRPV